MQTSGPLLQTSPTNEADMRGITYDDPKGSLGSGTAALEGTGISLCEIEGISAAADIVRAQAERGTTGEQGLNRRQDVP